MLGPLLFLLHINDLPAVVTSQVRIFADDCLLYRPILSEADQEHFQNDLDSLQRWGDAWGMRFNAKKCHIMRISRSSSPFTRFYSLCNTVLSEVSCAKYLGINISNDLQWSAHITSISSRANSSLGYIRRNLRGCPSKLRELAYISMVRSALEYGATVWDPYLAKDKNSIEKVQRRAARFIKSDYSRESSVTEMIRDLGWQDLASRRKDLRLALLFKVVNGHTAVTVSDLELSTADSRTRRNHPFKFSTKRASSKEFNNFFPRNTVTDWNNLPASVVLAPSTASFKAQLAKVNRADYSLGRHSTPHLLIHSI